MTNFEKYKDEILRIATERDSNPAKKDGVVVACKGLACAECDFGGIGNCKESRFRWLYEDDGQDRDRCDDCVHENKGLDELPRTECCNNYASKFERRPKKTRHPNAQIDNSTGVIVVCPRGISGEIPYNSGRWCAISCAECCQNYWLQEVEE